MLRNFGPEVAGLANPGWAAAAVVILLLSDACGGVAEDTVVSIVKPPLREKRRSGAGERADPDQAGVARCWLRGERAAAGV